MIAGATALVNYGEPGPVWHARALLAHAGNNDWAILTPDHDVYVETLAPDNPDFTDFHYCGMNGAVPARINPAHIYGFAGMTPAEFGAFRLQGEALVGVAGGVALAPAARGGAVAPAVPIGPAPVVAAGAAAPPAAGVPDTWVAVEDGGNFKRGDIVISDPNPLPAGHVMLQDRAVIPVPTGCLFVKKVCRADVSGMRLEDLRTLPVRFDNQGVRRMEFHNAVSLMDDTEPQGGGLQLTGPPSALNLLKAMRDQAFSPATFHEHWVRTNEIAKGDRSVYEHEVLSRILESMAVIDQLNIPALQSAELICRRLQVIREAHRISPGQPDYSSADYFMGWRYKKSGQGIDSGLAAHVANELKSDAAIAKESRKAREEQAARRKSRPGKKATEGGQDS